MTALLLAAACVVTAAPSPRTRLLPPAAMQWTRWLIPFSVGAGLTVFLLLGRLSVAVATLTAGLTLVWTVRDTRQRARTRRREAATVTFLGHLIGELQAGSPTGQALTRAVAEIPDSAPPELSRTLRLLAADPRAIRDDPGPPELATLRSLWELADRRGLPLVPLMQQARAGIDARVRHRGATTATLQGPQATAVILTLLPVAGVGMGTAMGADPLGFLFGGGLGGILLVAGVGLASAGFAWSRHIITKAAP
ncbi:type II secretion system F family protein [Corynebacterium suedekumii]|uniref:Type II secretion protein F n=1 Tax=Corynebacterium suedekumii TaxID=3049801 RepID=A0ABY8VND9_9CORY|nr:type II secretion protein F [Corynebacterium suedekumii]WIM71171.1 type II secretion protein F [Corynebacterium suedekumii]